MKSSLSEFVRARESNPSMATTPSTAAPQTTAQAAIPGGAGIFINPYVVAKQVHTPALILGAWLLGGIIAIAGAFIYAELAQLLPEVGGQYAYLREAYSPLVAFLYGWVLLLVIQTGGMAAVTITFVKYFLEVTHTAAPV